ncbi:endoribonuclease ZC3H12A [Nematostella vectensis]|uniref:endoribonuclease ZC3H12A n=1 Tax=Nematostella vectensis TaxID=45351 RepID=UPI0020778EA7|nr:endoribonuclease ZC3H12A [Nematostella vectensis]
MADTIQDEIAVQNDKKSMVAQTSERIRMLFNVNVTFSHPETSGYQWVQLKGSKDGVLKAKEYIKSLCNPEIQGTKVEFDERFYDAIHEYSRHVEKNSCAIVMFSAKNEALIQGSAMAVAIASSSIEERLNELKAGLQHSFQDRSNNQRTGNVSSSRTYANSQSNIQTGPYIDPSLEEFAMKLGYTKEDIYQVVRKQGKEVDQNTLLHELIKVSAPGRPRQQENPPQTLPPGPAPLPVPTRRGDIVARGAPSMSQLADRGVIPDTSIVFPKGANMLAERPPEEEAKIYHDVVGPKESSLDTELRHIVIDGSNVAMSHGNQQCFSCQGIKLCVEWFKKRGHKEITVFVPQWRKEAPRIDTPMEDQDILLELERQRHVVFTPSRRVNGRRIVCYDDRFILRLASEIDGIIVSNDNFRDLFDENPKWQEVIEHRILMYSFVGDIFMVPDDPLGRHGPTLNDFLRKGSVSHPRICPYLKRCTYGLRCKFYHPERDPGRQEKQELRQVTSSISQGRYLRETPQGNGGMLQTQDSQHKARAAPRNGGPQYTTSPYGQLNMQYSAALSHRQALTMRDNGRDMERHTKSSATRTNYDQTDGMNSELFNELITIFPDNEEAILKIMRENPNADKQLLANLVASCV